MKSGWRDAPLVLRDLDRAVFVFLDLKLIGGTRTRRIPFYLEKETTPAMNH